MLFKKEFDIDKEFFTEKETKPKKTSVAIKVFVSVLLLTFSFLCISAFTFNFNSRFGNKDVIKTEEGLKEAQEYYFNAVELFDKGDYEGAVENLNKQLAIVEDPDAYCYLGKINKEKGELELAIENFKKALDIKPNFFEANYELGKIYYSLNDYKTASKYLTNACVLNIENQELMSITAETYKRTGKSDEAILLFEKILEKDPKNAFANSKIGEIYYQRSDYRKAIQYFEESVQVSYDEMTAIQLAKSYFELGDYNSSEDVIKEILLSDKENKQALSLKKAIEYKNLTPKTNPDKAVQKQSVEKAPLNKEVLNNYIKEIEVPIKTNWTPPMGSNLKKASVKFTINKDGELLSNDIYKTSGMREFDKSALNAIEMSKPYPPLPLALDRDTLDIIFTFDFNVK